MSNANNTIKGKKENPTFHIIYLIFLFFLVIMIFYFNYDSGSDNIFIITFVILGAISIKNFFLYKKNKRRSNPETNDNSESNFLVTCPYCGEIITHKQDTCPKCKKII